MTTRYLPRLNYFYTLEATPRDSAPNAWRASWWDVNGEEYVAVVYGDSEAQARCQLLAKMRKMRKGERTDAEGAPEQGHAPARSTL